MASAVGVVGADGHPAGRTHVGSSGELDPGAPVEKDTICRIYSVWKVVTAVAALQLFEAGKLQLGSPVTNWLPELRGSRC